MRIKHCEFENTELAMSRLVTVSWDEHLCLGRSMWQPTAYGGVHFIRVGSGRFRANGLRRAPLYRQAAARCAKNLGRTAAGPYPLRQLGKASHVRKYHPPS